ncbi:GTP-binding protein [Niabella aurantiaca]|uniref:GTP-binding protein n=1 Tax=Niabella aurantiaca TaxID=379900 RepID=UPI0003680128|nr:GTP-binding protein [Niabella aurantiaca]
MKTNRVKLIFVGGFLGAGKTTLLQQASALLAAGGRSVGLITNDQADALVDTHLLTKQNSMTREISGSCFCCNYEGFAGVLSELAGRHTAPDVIIAEPVGSCTDISATLLQPLKSQMQAVIELAPFTVLADPEKLERILDGDPADLHPSAAYIYRKQLEESDRILISKTDTIRPERLQVLTEKVKLAFPDHEVGTISARRGTGVKEWLDQVLQGTVSGSRIAAIDYDVYAEGEAVLGWLNASVLLQGTAVDWDRFLENYFHRLNALLGSPAGIGHIKILIEGMGDRYCIGNQTGAGHTLQFRNSAGISNIAQMTINARVEADPAALEQMVFAALAQSAEGGLFYEIRQCRSLRPGYPRPTHRYSHVVS